MAIGRIAETPMALGMSSSGHRADRATRRISASGSRRAALPHRRRGNVSGEPCTRDHLLAYPQAALQHLGLDALQARGRSRATASGTPSIAPTQRLPQRDCLQEGHRARGPPPVGGFAGVPGAPTRVQEHHRLAEEPSACGRVRGAQSRPFGKAAELPRTSLSLVLGKCWVSPECPQPRRGSLPRSANASGARPWLGLRWWSQLGNSLVWVAIVLPDWVGAGSRCRRADPDVRHYSTTPSSTPLPSDIRAGSVADRSDHRGEYS